MSKKIELKKGDRYGKLCIIREVKSKKTPCGSVIRNFLCRCNCGKKTVVTLGRMRNGKTSSCGCFRKDVVRKRLLVHGHNTRSNKTKTGGRKRSRTYNSWTNMKNRCTNKRVEKYKNYGARGVTIDPRWHSFLNFLEDMGERPEGKTLDRINNDGNYSKENCRWATTEQQANNKTTSHFVFVGEEKMTLSQLSKRYGVRLRNVKNKNYKIDGRDVTDCVPVTA